MLNSSESDRKLFNTGFNLHTADPGYKKSNSYKTLETIKKYLKSSTVKLPKTVKLNTNAQNNVKKSITNKNVFFTLFYLTLIMMLIINLNILKRKPFLVKNINEAYHIFSIK